MIEYKDLNPARKLVIHQLIKMFPAAVESKKIVRAEIVQACEAFGKSVGYLNWLTGPNNSYGRGIYNFPIPTEELEMETENVSIPTFANVNVYVDQRSDQEIKNFFTEKYEAIEEITSMVSEGNVRSLIISGSPGFGKTTRVTNKLKDLDCEYFEVNVKITPRMLYKKLYEYRQSGQILVIDDADNCFQDEDGLNLIKSATDSKLERRVSRFVEGKIMTDGDDPEEIPKTFIYEGQIIFITNLNLQQMSEGSSKNSEHIKAIISRCSYIDLKINNIRERLIAIKMMIEVGILNQFECSEDQEDEIYKFLVDNGEKFRDLSIRTLINIMPYYLYQDNWQKLISHAYFK